MKFKKGKLYKSKNCCIVIMCTSNKSTEDYFSGVVVSSQPEYDTGEYSTTWIKKAFKRYKFDTN